MRKIASGVALGVVVLAVAVMVGPEVVSAQGIEQTRTVTGSVKDALDRPVANATVTIIDEDGTTDQRMAETKTNAAGGFTVAYSVKNWDPSPLGGTSTKYAAPPPDIYVVASLRNPRTGQQVPFATTGVYANVEKSVLPVFVAHKAITDYLTSLDTVEKKLDTFIAAFQKLKAGPTSGAGWEANLAAVRTAAQEAQSAKRAYPGVDQGVKTIDAGLAARLSGWVSTAKAMTPQGAAATKLADLAATKTYIRGLRFNIKWAPAYDGCTPNSTADDGCDCVEHKSLKYQSCEPFLSAW